MIKHDKLLSAEEIMELTEINKENAIAHGWESIAVGLKIFLYFIETDVINLMSEVKCQLQIILCK